MTSFLKLNAHMHLYVNLNDSNDNFVHLLCSYCITSSTFNHITICLFSFFFILSVFIFKIRCPTGLDHDLWKLFFSQNFFFWKKQKQKICEIWTQNSEKQTKLWDINSQKSDFVSRNPRFLFVLFFSQNCENSMAELGSHNDQIHFFCLNATLNYNQRLLYYETM